jgi:glycosyltransferase involved in cell wall biosynthesis
VIGTVALFRPRKGLEVLLHSIKELKDTGLNIKLKAVGTFENSEYEKQIHQLAEELEVVDLIEWVGFCSDVHSELQKMHIFVLPSLFGEGLPMVVIEAMSMGAPVVSTDVEGIPDVLQNGQCGEIVEPNNSKALTTGIKNYILNNKDPLVISEKALERQRDHYSDKAMAKGVAKVYDAVLGSEGVKEAGKP